MFLIDRMAHEKNNVFNYRKHIDMVGAQVKMAQKGD